MSGSQHPGRIEVFRSFTRGLASLSKCTERQVAALITDSQLTQIYSIGINGGPKGLADCLCVIEGKYGCIHAEINALIKCNSEDTDKVMFCTLAPCKQCATAIINAPGGFSTVYYFDVWKRPSTGAMDDSGDRLLRAAGISVKHV